jgi:acetoin utilization protein AcuB
MKTIPTISKYMTTCPVSVSSDLKLSEAMGTMKKNNIRHLPVIDKDQIVGLITDRDALLVESFQQADPGKITVKDVMQKDVYYVTPDAPIDAVAREMAVHKYGSAVVVSNDKVVGIFTTVDAMNVISDIISHTLHN